MRKIRGVTKRSPLERGQAIKRKIISRDLRWMLEAVQEFNASNWVAATQGISLCVDRDYVCRFEVTPNYRSLALALVPQFTIKLAERVAPSIKRNIVAGRNTNRILLELHDRSGTKLNINAASGDVFMLYARVITELFILVERGDYIKEAYGEKPARDALEEELAQLFK